MFFLINILCFYFLFYIFSRKKLNKYFKVCLLDLLQHYFIYKLFKFMKSDIQIKINVRD